MGTQFILPNKLETNMDEFKNQRHKPNPPCDESDSEPESGILNERVLFLVFESMKFDLATLCATARVNRKLRAVAKRILWRELCSYRAPCMVAALVHGLPGSRIGGGWHALAKLLFFCCGCQPSPNVQAGAGNGNNIQSQHLHGQSVQTSAGNGNGLQSQDLRVQTDAGAGNGNNIQSQHLSAGHFVRSSRFSKTSGRSFLTKTCDGDLLYLSDPCEHAMVDGDYDLGVYRGVYRGFIRSKTRACLIGRQVQLEDHVRCPYCGARVWSMSRAKLVPKSAARRLGTNHDGLEYFVCVNGHLHGACWLVPLSSDEDDNGDLNEDEDDDEDAEFDRIGQIEINGYGRVHGSSSSSSMSMVKSFNNRR